MEQYQRQRSFIIIAVIAVLLIIFVAFFARHGVVIVSSDDSLSLSVRKDDGTKVVDSTKHYFAFAHTGTYTASGSTDSKATSKSFTVHPFSFQHITLHASRTAYDASPVTDYEGIKTVQPTKDSFRFYDTSSQTIRTVADNKITTISSKKFASVNWASDGKTAIALSTDDTPNVYVISSNTVTKLPLPKQIKDPDTMSAAITAKGRIFLAIDNQLFTAANAHSEYQRLGTIDKNTTVTSAAGDTALLTQYVSTTAETFSYNLITMSTDGTSASTNIALNYKAALSPDGTKVFVATSGSLGTVYDSSFDKLYNVPAANATTAGWVNNTTVVYTSGNNVWEYDQSTKSANEIARMPTVLKYTGLKYSEPSLSTLDIYTDQVSGAVYLKIQSDDTTTLYRVNTSEKQINKTITAIGLTAVTTFPNFCTAYYVANTRPVFYVYGAVVPQDCVDAVNNFMSALDIPSSAYSVINT